MRMRAWITLIALLAFVVTTMPSISHASISQNEATSHTHSDLSGKDHHCHHHSKSSEKKPGSSDPSIPCKKSCCDKSCKCVGNSCSSAVKASGLNDLTAFSPKKAKSQFGLLKVEMISTFPNRIKRPPRA